VDHWLWQEPDKRATIVAALEWYRTAARDIRDIKDTVSEIKTAISGGAVVVRERKDEQERRAGIDPRLVRNIDRFLDL
jgi:hypothetical protein